MSFPVHTGDSLLSAETKQRSHAQGVTKQADSIGEKKMPDDNKKMITVDEADYKAALAKYVSQVTQIEQLKAQLHDATEALTVIKAKMDAAEKEEKDAVIDELVRDSQGKLTGEMLQAVIAAMFKKADPEITLEAIKALPADDYTIIAAIVGKYLPGFLRLGQQILKAGSTQTQLPRK